MIRYAFKTLMKLKPKKLTILGILIILAIGMYLWVPNKAPKVDSSKISTTAVIEYPAEHNYRQTINDCGPFNVAAVVRALMKKKVSSAEFAEDIG